MDFGQDDPIVSEAFGQDDPIIRPVGAGESFTRAGKQSMGLLGRALSGLFNPGAVVDQALADNLRRDPRPEARAAADQLDPFGAMMGAGRLGADEIPETANAYRAAKIASLPGAAVEVPASMLSSGIVAPVASGLAGLGTLGAHMMGLTDTQPADVVQNVQSAATYQPVTPAGKEAIGAISYPFEKLAQGARFAGEHVQDATGSPVAATAVDTAINALPYLLPGLKGERGGVLPKDTITPEQVDAWTRTNPEAAGIGAPPPKPTPTGTAVVPHGEPFTDAEFWQPGARSLPPAAAPADPATNAADAVTRALTGQAEAPAVSLSSAAAPDVPVSSLGDVMQSIAQSIPKPVLDDFLARATQAQQGWPGQIRALLGRGADAAMIPAAGEESSAALMPARAVVETPTLPEQPGNALAARASEEDMPPGSLAREDTAALTRDQRAPAAQALDDNAVQSKPSTAAEIDSPEFRQWFGDSKVAARDGAPLTVYHGTGEDFHTFRDDALGDATGHSTSPLGHFFTEDRGQAQHYAENASEGRPADERVVDAHLAIRNPKEMSLDEMAQIDSPEAARALKAKLQAEGYDGIHVADGKQWIAFEPSQIKSASENVGSYGQRPVTRAEARSVGMAPSEANRLQAGGDIRFSRGDYARRDDGGTIPPHEQEASGIPQGLPVKQTDDTRRLAERFNRRSASGTAGEQARFRAIRADALPDVLSRALGELGRATGTRIVVVRNLNPKAVDFNGVTLRDGVVYVDERAQHPATTVAAHEFFHQLERDHPDLAEELRAEVRRQGDLGAYAENLRRRGDAKAERNAESELTGDAVGDAFTDPEFLERMARESPSLFRRVADALMRFLDGMIGRIRDLGSHQYLRDVQAFRDKLADVMRRYGERAARDGGSEPEPAFSRRASDEPAERYTTPDRPEGVPPRKPGESQSDYARRTARKNNAEIREATSIKARQKIIGRHGIREMLAKRQRALDVADATFKEFRKLFDKTDPRINFANVDDWETGKPIRDLDFRDFIDKMTDGFDERIQKLHQLDPTALPRLIENYLPHMYRDPTRAGKWFSDFIARRPLGGDRAFLKQRTWPTLKEAMASGLEPITSNPVDWVLLKYASMDKYTSMLELKKDLTDRGWLPLLKADQEPPFGYARVNDPSFRGVAVPQSIARDLNDYLKPGFGQYAAWRALRGIENLMVAADLGFSGFHAVFTSTDNIVMHFDVAMRRAALGDFGGAASTLVKGLTSIATSPFEGARLNQEWRGLRTTDANTSAILDALERGGARWKMSPTDYQNAIPQFARAFRQMTGAGIGSHLAGKSAGQVAIGAAKVPWMALQAAAETGSWLIHHALVPNQKMAARVLLYKYELDRLAGKLGKDRGDYAGILEAMHPDVVRQIAGRVNDVVDFRLGQMAYDNRFWPKVVKEIAQAVVMAPGWQYGMVQTVLGAGKAVRDLVQPPKYVAPIDKDGEITDADMGRVGSNLSYFLTLALTLGGGMALLQYLLTGQGPSEIRDYFFPKTGRRNNDDSEERLSFPNYWVDHYKLTTHPLETASHKIHPLWKMMWELGHNKDYLGTQIRDPKVPAMEQAKELAEYVASKFVPITVGKFIKGQDQGHDATRQVGKFFGIDTAPVGVSQSDFQAYVAKGGDKGWGDFTKTPEEARRKQLQRNASAALRRGDEPDYGDLSEDEMGKAAQDARTFVPALRFKNLSNPDKLHAYDLATPEERERYELRDTLGHTNLERSAPFKRLPTAEQDRLRQQLQGIRGGR